MTVHTAMDKKDKKFGTSTLSHSSAKGPQRLVRRISMWATFQPKNSSVIFFALGSIPAPSFSSTGCLGLGWGRFCGMTGIMSGQGFAYGTGGADRGRRIGILAITAGARSSPNVSSSSYLVQHLVDEAKKYCVIPIHVLEIGRLPQPVG